MVRIDSEYVHTEIVREALRLIHDEGFKGAEDEFLHAHEHYRAGETKDAIVDANGI